MKIVGRPDRVLRRHSNARRPFEKWLKMVKTANWQKFADVKGARTDVDKVGNCYVFDIGGNKFRLITKITYATDEFMGTVRILALLTHEEYDRQGWKGDC
jgi:mRNA interferase HigB